MLQKGTVGIDFQVGEGGDPVPQVDVAGAVGNLQIQGKVAVAKDVEVHRALGLCLVRPLPQGLLLVPAVVRVLVARAGAGTSMR